LVTSLLSVVRAAQFSRPTVARL